MIKETNMEAVKKGAKTLLDVKIRKRAGSGKEILIDHPFYGDILQPCRDSNGEKQHLNILESPENLAKARAVKSEIIDEAEDIIAIGNWLNKPYRLIFIKLIENYLSLEDLSLYLTEFWGGAEDEYTIGGVKKSRVKRWLTACNKNLCMSEQLQQIFDSLGEEVTIYRGVTDMSKGNLESTMTWTVSYDDAVWYAQRYLISPKIKKRYVYKATIDKKHIYICLHTESTDVIVDDQGIKDITLVETFTR